MRKLGIIKEKMETEEMADMDEKRFAIKETVSAKEIKMLRKKLGLTQRDFARLLDCSKPTVERLERRNCHERPDGTSDKIIGSGHRIYTFA